MGSQPRLVLDDSVFVKLSPLQRKILQALAEGPLTLEKLSLATGSSVYTIGKQLSLLQFRARYNPLESKGLVKPLVRKNKDCRVRTTYFLCLDSGAWKML